MFTKRRTCPESSRKCLLIAGKRCSISPNKSGSVSELHSIVCTPSVNRRSAEGISTVIFISICFPDLQLLNPGNANLPIGGLRTRRQSGDWRSQGVLLVSRDRCHTIVEERFKDREARLDRG